MEKIKLLGYGAVIKKFLETAEQNFPNLGFEIYSRLVMPEKISEKITFHNIKHYVPDASVTFFCCSIPEENFLRNLQPPLSRLDVAKPNLALLKNFIAEGFFNTGLHFILTNPSELMAEAIIHMTNNKNIFALGLSIDYVRYQGLLNMSCQRKLASSYNINSLSPNIKFNLIGNHWDFPLVNFDPHYTDYQQSLLIELHELLQKKIQTEFQGFKPPVKSGAQALHDAVAALYHRIPLVISGFIPDHEVVGGGLLNTVTFEFNQPEVNKHACDLLIKTIRMHKKTYERIIHEDTY